MCGRYASQLPPDALRAALRTLNPLVNHPPSWNVALTDSALVVLRHHVARLMLSDSQGQIFLTVGLASHPSRSRPV